jgi:hypothetical protein
MGSLGAVLGGCLAGLGGVSIALLLLCEVLRLRMRVGIAAL